MNLSRTLGQDAGMVGAMQGLHLLAGLLLIALLVRELRHRPGLLAAVIAWLAAVTVAAHVVSPAWFPADAFSVLFEGRTTRVVNAMGGRTTMYAWLGLAHLDATAPARLHVTANLWAAAVAWPLLALRVSVWTGRAWSGPLLLVLALPPWTPVFLQTVVSDGAQGYLALGAAALAWGGAAVADPRGPVRVGGVVLAALAVVGMASARAELVLLGVVVPVAAVAAVLGPARVADLEGRWQDRLPPLAPLQTAAGVLLTVVGSYAVTLAGYAVMGEPAPFPPWSDRSPGQTTLRWIQDLTLLYPLGMGLLVTLGMAWCARRPLSTLGAGVAVLVVLRVYASNSHFGGAWFELLRYLGNLQGPLWLFAVAGVAEAALWAATVPGRFAVIAGGLVGLAVRPDPPPYGPTEDDAPWLVSRNHQLEGRFLLRALDAHPDCVFRSRVVERDVSGRGAGEDWQTGDGPPDGGYRHDSLWFGCSSRGPKGPGRSPRGRFFSHVDTEGALPRHVAEVLEGAPCELFYRGLDCSFEGVARCEEAEEGLELLMEETHEALEYNLHHGVRDRRFRLAVYRVR